jgi:hypothetical protein
METALRTLGVFIMFDVLAAVLLIILIGMVRNRQSPNQRVSFCTLLGFLLFLAVMSGFIYGGIWMCLQATT